MAKRKVNLKWYVLLYDSTKRKIINYNVLEGYEEEIYNRYKKKKITNIKELKENLKVMLQSRYWSRCEYELIVGYHISEYPDDFEKIDAFRQIEMNFDRIIEYINTEMQLNLK